MSKTLAHLDLKVTDMRAGLDSVKNTTRWNSESLRNLAVSLNQIKVEVKDLTDHLILWIYNILAGQLRRSELIFQLNLKYNYRNFHGIFQ